MLATKALPRNSLLKSVGHVSNVPVFIGFRALLPQTARCGEAPRQLAASGGGLA